MISIYLLTENTRLKVCRDFFLFVVVIMHAIGIKKIDENMLYRMIENQLSPASSFLFLSSFLSFHMLNNEIFRQRFL